MYSQPGQIEAAAFSDENTFISNEYMILKNGKMSALARYNPFNETIDHIEKVAAYGITPRNAEQIFALDALMDDKISNSFRKSRHR
jgi:PhoH-like ATPase